MTHALILGNSHAVPLRHAWKALDETHPRHRLSFFVAPQPIFKYLRGGGSSFGLPPGRVKRKAPAIVQRLNGRTRIDFGEFDQIVLVGFGDRSQQISEILLGCDIDGLREVGAPSRLSRPAFETICRSIAEEAISQRLLRRSAIRPLAVVEKNRPGEICVASDDPRFTAWPGLVARPEGVDAALGVYSRIFADVLGRKGIALIPQPPETIQPNGLTEARFIEGSISLTGGKPHPQGDALHANAAYGELCLARIFDFLDESRPAAVAARA